MFFFPTFAIAMKMGKKLFTPSPVPAPWLMRTLVSGVVVLACACCPAQESGSALRDSLARATDVLAYHPDSIDLRLKKAAWNIRLEQWEYAKDDLDKVLFLDGRNVAGLFYRAYVNEKLRRYNFARLDYQNLLQVVPGNFEAQLGLALLNQKDSHFTEALDGLNRLVEAHPDSAVAYAALGGVEKERGMAEAAEFDYARAVALDPANADYRIELAGLQIALGRKREARKSLEALVAMGVSRAELRGLFDELKKK